MSGLNKVFQAKVRLGIMTVLVGDEESDFSTLKKRLDLTDGNLASHLGVLEDKDYIEVEKKFVDRKPKTLYRSTEKGREEFNKHLSQLKKVIDLAEGEGEDV